MLSVAESKPAIARPFTPLVPNLTNKVVMAAEYGSPYQPIKYVCVRHSHGTAWLIKANGRCSDQTTKKVKVVLYENRDEIKSLGPYHVIHSIKADRNEFKEVARRLQSYISLSSALPYALESDLKNARENLDAVQDSISELFSFPGRVDCEIKTTGNLLGPTGSVGCCGGPEGCDGSESPQGTQMPSTASARLLEAIFGPRYVGKLVFVEPPLDDQRTLGWFGEYICLHQSGNSLYCVATTSTIDSAFILRFVLSPGDGRKGMSVIATREDDEYIECLAGDLSDFSVEPKPKAGEQDRFPPEARQNASSVSEQLFAMLARKKSRKAAGLETSSLN